MSNMYAIKEETLTAIGDAVRLKMIGNTKAPYVSGVDRAIIYNSYINVELPNSVKNIKITGTGRYAKGNPATSSTVQSLGIAPGIFSSSSSARSAEGYFIAYEYNSETIYDTYYFDFEALVEGNTLTMVTSKNSSSANYFTLTYTAIGLDENGNEFAYTPLEMAEAINRLDAIPTGALSITGDCSSRFANGGWNWFINAYGDKITTQNISNAERMFYYLKNIDSIPFDINIASNIGNVSYIFASTGLKTLPYIIGPEKTPPTSSYSGIISLDSMFGSCTELRYIPDDYFWKMIPNKEFWEAQAEKATQAQSYLFNNCNSLRELPDITMIGGNWTSSYSSVYYYLLYYCYALNKIVNLPVYGTFSSNALGTMINNCYRAKEFMFAVNADGTPKTAQWKNQTIDLSTNFFGYVQRIDYILNYNSGITADKEVTDDATYQALKNDPDWFTTKLDYCRYNHDSAVNTINSLPDCSATGTNTIKFMGQAGALTDGGAINTLTEEEIAVAAAKGWTVTLV